MAAFEHLVKSYDVSDQLDDIANADPPAYRPEDAEATTELESLVGRLSGT